MEQGTENYCKTKETLKPYCNHADNLKIPSKGEGSVNALQKQTGLFTLGRDYVPKRAPFKTQI